MAPSGLPHTSRSSWQHDGFPRDLEQGKFKVASLLLSEWITNIWEKWGNMNIDCIVIQGIILDFMRHDSDISFYKKCPWIFWVAYAKVSRSKKSWCLRSAELLEMLQWKGKQIRQCYKILVISVCARTHAHEFMKNNYSILVCAWNLSLRKNFKNFPLLTHFRIMLFPENVSVTILKLLEYIVFLFFSILVFRKDFLLGWLFKIDSPI